MDRKKKVNNYSLVKPCPECDTPLTLSKDHRVGEIIECDACGAESEIIALNPVKLVLLEEEK